MSTRAGDQGRVATVPAARDGHGLLELPSRRDEHRSAPIAAAPTSRAARLRKVLLLGDVAAVAVAALLASLIAGAPFDPIYIPGVIGACLLAAPVLLALGHSGGLYHLSERHIDHTLAEELGPTVTAVTIWAWITLLATAAVPGVAPQVGFFAVLWAGSICLMLASRSISRRATRDREWNRQNVMLIGDEIGNERVLRRLHRHPECGVDPVASLHSSGEGLRGYIYDDEGRSDSHVHGDGSPEDVLDNVRRAGVERVFITGWDGPFDERSELIRLLAGSGLYVDIVSGEPEALCSGASIHHIEGLPIMTVRPTRMTRAGRQVKRGMDIIGAGVGLFVLTPMLAYIAVRLKLDSPGPALYRQRRAGRDGRMFNIVKFRTMCEDADEMQEELRELVEEGDLFKLRDDPRVTSFGAKLRRRSLDELPQLWNVLKGEMSLVGPRPLPPEEVPMVSDHFTARGRVRPGMTGPWQIHGRSDIPFEDMVKLDYMYASGWSLREDLRLLLRTLSAVVTGRGAY